MNVLLVNLHDAANIGDSAIVAGMINSIRIKYKNCNIAVLTDNVKSCESLNGVSAIKNTFGTRNILKVVGCYFAINILKFCPWNQIKKDTYSKFGLSIFEKSDMVISVGGQYFNEYYYPSIYLKLFLLHIAQLIGKPTYVFAISNSEFNKYLLKKYLKKIMNSCKQITVREKISYDAMLKVGVDRSKISLVADAAFMANKNSNKLNISNLIKKKEGVENNVNVSISVRSWGNSSVIRKYVVNVKNVVEYLIDTYNANIYFVSTCTGFEGYNKDDRIIAREIYDLLDGRYKTKVEIIDRHLPYEGLIEFYSKMTFHIGTRLHSNILSLLAGTPIIPIEYEHKTSGVLKVFEHINIYKYHDLNIKEMKKDIQKNIDENNKIADENNKILCLVKKEALLSADIIFEDYLNNEVY